MVFEAIGTMMGELNFFGYGAFLVILALVFAISRGITKDKSDMMLYFIIFGSFATILLFSDDVIQTGLFLVTAIVIVIWGWLYLSKSIGQGSG
jgi:hypothetical protein